MSPGLIRMITDDGQPWEVKIGPRTLVEVHGTGGPGMLRPGVCVRFEATLVGRRNVAEEIAELTVFSPAETGRYGLGFRRPTRGLGAGWR